MHRDLLGYYDIILERLEKVNWQTMYMTFDLLNIEDKNILEDLIAMDDENFKKAMLNLEKEQREECD